MAHCTIRIELMIHSLRTARTTEAVNVAAGFLYESIIPLLTPCCDRVLSRTRYLSWRTAEDLASETLVAAIPALRDGRCPDVSNGGLLKFLVTVARRDVLDEFRHEGRNWRCDTDTSLLEAAAIRTSNSRCDDNVDAFSADSTATFPAAYEVAVATLPSILRDTWRLVVEQETPMLQAAAQLGINRATVWRRVQSARALMAEHLQHFAP